MGDSLLSHLTGMPLLCLLMFKNTKMEWLHSLNSFKILQKSFDDFVFDSHDHIDAFSPTVGEHTPLHEPTCVVMLVMITSVTKQIEKR